MADQPKSGNGTKPVTIKPEQEIRQSLALMEPQFKMALPPQISPEKFIRVVMTAIQQNPKLIENRVGLYGAAMKCAQDGLLPDGKEAALVPYGATIQYLPMIGGILKKVRNSGELATISAHVVYERDEFTYELGDNERIIHKPMLGAERGKPILTYAIAKTKDGGIYREIMSEAQVQAVRNVSAAKNGGPWTGDFADEMRRKTVLRRLSKRLPMSTDLEQVIQRDDELYDFSDAAPKTSESGKRKTRLSTIIETQSSPSAEPQAEASAEVPV
jgi:recombination protein RecT